MTDNAADFRGGERHAFTLAVPANFRARRRYDNELILVEVRPPADDLARLFLTDVDVADDEAVGLRVRADRDDAPDDDAAPPKVPVLMVPLFVTVLEKLPF